MSPDDETRLPDARTAGHGPRLLAGLFALALAARLAAAVIMPQNADDSVRYIRQARNLVEHGTFSSGEDGSPPAMTDTPGFAMVLAVFIAALGETALALRLPGVIIGAAAAPLACMLASELGARREAALAAGAVTAVLPGLVGAAALVLTESVYASVLTSAIILYARAWKAAGSPEVSPRTQALGAAAAGAVLACAALVRPVAGAFPAAGALGLLIVSWRRGAGVARGALSGTVLVAAFALVMTPWAARNYAVSGRFVPLTTRAPILLWLGSYEPTGGAFNDEAYTALSRRLGEASPDEMRSEAVGRILSSPLRWSAWGLRKVATVWLGLPGGARLLRGRPFLASVVWPPDLLAVALAAAALGMAAAGMSPERSRGLWAVGLYLAVESAVYFATVGIARFRVPMMPAVVALAAVAAGELYARWCRRSDQGVAAPGGADGPRADDPAAEQGGSQSPESMKTC